MIPFRRLRSWLALKTGDIQTLSPGFASTTTVNSSQLKGTTTNDSAAAGIVGEFMTGTVAVGSAAPIATGTPQNLTVVTLTAGDWDVEGVMDFAIAATTSITNLTAALSLVTNTLPTQAGGGGLGTDPLNVANYAPTVPGGLITLGVGPVRVSVSASTSVFFVASAVFTIAGVSIYGTIRARRVR